MDTVETKVEATVAADAKAEAATKERVLRCRILGGGMVWAIIIPKAEGEKKIGIQAINKGEAIKRAKQEMPNTIFTVETVR